MDRGSWHCTGDRDQDHPPEKGMKKSKMAAWGGLTNNCEKKRSEKQRRKGKINPFECIYIHTHTYACMLSHFSCVQLFTTPWTIVCLPGSFVLGILQARILEWGLCNNLELGDGEGDGRDVQEGGDMCIPMADSCWCLAESKKIL